MSEDISKIFGETDDEDNVQIEATYETGEVVDESEEKERCLLLQREIIKRHNTEVERIRNNSAPGEPSYSDDQGNFQTCTRHALSKVYLNY